MAFKKGTAVSIYFAGNKIAGMSSFSFSGFTRETLEDTEFGDDIKTYVFGIGDGGNIEMSGLADPDDTTGQVAWDALAIAGTTVPAGTTAGLWIKVDNTSGWTLSGGTILPTKSRSIGMEHNSLAKINLSAQISGGYMVLI